LAYPWLGINFRLEEDLLPDLRCKVVHDHNLSCS